MLQSWRGLGRSRAALHHAARAGPGTRPGSVQGNYCSSQLLGPGTSAATLPSAHSSARSYHSYPDPEEKSVISFARSEQTQTLDKTLPEFQLHEKFKIEKKFPGVPESLGIDIGNEPATLSTILGNGLTIATEQRHGLMNSIAFLVKTGSSHEHQAGDAESQNTGVTHFMELNGFRSTQNRTVDQLIAEVEALGGMIQCVSTRENIIYCIDVLQEHTEKALDILADTVMNPTFPEAELDMTKQIIQFQRDQFPPDMLSKDAIQRAAYKGSPLSNHHFCPKVSWQNMMLQISVMKLKILKFWIIICILLVASMLFMFMDMI